MRSTLGKRRLRHVMSAVVCGLDVHKDSTYATILNLEGKIVNQTRMNNERVLSYLSHFKVERVATESVFEKWCSENFVCKQRQTREKFPSCCWPFARD